jgi:limonene-1,2-epoxide hydrolase
MTRMRSTAWLASAAAALALGGCGGGDDGDRRTGLRGPEQRSTPAPTEEPAEPAAKVDPADVRVVRAWADTLRRGDIRGAARYFALPSVVANGTAPIKLTTAAEVRFFNRTLPCGAEVIGTEPAPHGFFIATFRLTERPGAGECGSGTGETARTAFRVRDDRITEWLRVQDVESAPEALS